MKILQGKRGASRGKVRSDRELPLNIGGFSMLRELASNLTPVRVSPEDRVMSLSEFALAANVSIATARRLIASKNGPAVIRLSVRRLGIRVGDYQRWLAERASRPVVTE